MSYFGGHCDSNQTGLSRGLRIHTLTNNHGYINIPLIYIVHVGQIKAILILNHDAGQGMLQMEVS